MVSSTFGGCVYLFTKLQDKELSCGLSGLFDENPGEACDLEGVNLDPRQRLSSVKIHLSRGASRAQEGAAPGASRDRKPRAEEKNFVDVGFHAFGIDAVEGGDEIASDNVAPSVVDSSDHHGCPRARPGGAVQNQGALSRGQAKGDGLPSSEKRSQEEEAELDDEMEGIGEVELVVASDLSVGVVPVASADSKGRSDVVQEGSIGKAPRAAATDDGVGSGMASGRPNDQGWEESKEASPGRRGVRKASREGAPNPLLAMSKGVGAGGACRKRAATANPQTCRGGGYPRVRGVEAEDERKASEGKGEAGKAEGVGDRGGEGTGEKEMGQEAADGEGEQAIAEPPPFDIMLTLDDDALHRIMLFIHPEDVMECRVVSSRWEFPVHEAVFEGFCRRTYMAQVRRMPRRRCFLGLSNIQSSFT